MAYYYWCTLVYRAIALLFIPPSSIFSFRRGAVYRGIYLPSLSGKLQDERLEVAYQKYSHRQRQRSLLLVNVADLCLKVRFRVDTFRAEICK